MKRILPIIFSFLLLIGSVSAGRVFAEDGNPVPQARLPCDVQLDPEFQSLRPYQAAPCEEASFTLFCGNKINIVETKTVRQKGEHACISRVWEVDKEYWIDLSETELPILGNTELVQNSQSDQETLDDATKLNEYVSWYLQGVNTRAEYGETKATDYETVNFSGPLQKLLPQAIAEAQRIVTIASASSNVSVPIDDDEPQISGEGPASHNQIVVCTQGGKPSPCYKGDGSAAQGRVYRLKDWSEGALSPVTTFFNWLGTDVWNNRYPPLPWQFSKQVLYQKAYNEWLGKTCAILPIDSLVCGDLPLLSNRNDFAALYTYVPLANTSDFLGKMPMYTVEIQPSSGTVMESSEWSKLAAPTLFYSHTKESLDLVTSLNKTFAPSGVGSDSIPPDSTENNNKCRILDSRTNPGDDLFPIKKKADVGADVKFKVTEFCNCTVEYDDFYRPTTVCHGQVDIGIHTDPNRVPFADEIWKSTVAGNASTFRKTYPKVGADAPVTCIADIPSVTKAVYVPVEGTDKITVEGPLKPGDSEVMDPENASIYFPHFGSVYDYFLKGIQTALRPKGYAESTPVSGAFCQKSSEDFGDICAVADAYNIPCCQLEGVAEIETGGGQNVGSGSCSTKNGNFNCCNGNVCGPSQVACGQYDGFAGSDYIDMCDPVGSAELLARAMLLKLCQAAGKCDTYDWEKEKSKAMQYSVGDGDYTATAYFYGLNNGCTVNACTEYRWGAGKTYCDSVESYCKTGNILPDNPHPAFCAACNEDLIRAGQTPINCSGP